MKRLLLSCLILLGACAAPEEGGQVSRASGQLLLDPSHGDQGSAWGRAECADCHSLVAIHRNADDIRGLVRAKGFVTCTGCHGDNGSGAARACGVCHNPQDLPDSPRQAGEHRHDFVAGEERPPADADCVVCHRASDMDGAFQLARDLTRLPDARQALSPYTAVSDFCLRCHNRDHPVAGFAIDGRDYADPLVAIEDDWRYVDKHGAVDGGGRRFAGLRADYAYATQVACSDCHSLHGTHNPGLLIAHSRQGATRLRENDPGWPVVVRGGDYSQLCVLCHAMTVEQEQGAVDTGNGLAGVHRVGEDCRPCHRHGEAAQAGL